MELSRRKCLAYTAGAVLAAGALALPASADEGNHGDAELLYGHGMVWNRDLTGVAGLLRLEFDLKLDLKAGTGLGTATDPVYADRGIHFAIDTIAQEKRPKGEVRYTMVGAVTAAVDDSNVGLAVKIVAETVGDTTAIAIRVGDLAFGGAGIVTKSFSVVALIGLILSSL